MIFAIADEQRQQQTDNDQDRRQHKDIAETVAMRNIQTGGRAIASDKLLAMLKYPIPSPKRSLGMISAATVEVAVPAIPHPNPCNRRIKTIIVTETARL